MSGSAVVIGSAHVDLISRAERMPGRGESVTGGLFSMAPGGKAGNQAIQLAQCGIETTLITRIGDDQFGCFLRTSLLDKGVRVDRIVTDSHSPTGASTILAGEGDYLSVIAPGAANSLNRADLETARSNIEKAELVVLQWELAPTIVEMAINYCGELGKTILFNASPAPMNLEAMSGLRWSAVDWLVANTFEASVLASTDIDDVQDAIRVATKLRQSLGVGNVLITMGKDGSVWVGPEDQIVESAFAAEVIDTVGAGDAFLGAFAAGQINGLAMSEALRRGSAAGAIAVGRSGAYDALPTAAEIDRFLAIYA